MSKETQNALLGILLTLIIASSTSSGDEIVDDTVIPTTNSKVTPYIPIHLHNTLCTK